MCRHITDGMAEHIKRVERDYTQYVMKTTRFLSYALNITQGGEILSSQFIRYDK